MSTNTYTHTTSFKSEPKQGYHLRVICKANYFIPRLQMQRLQELVLYQRRELKKPRPDHGQGIPFMLSLPGFQSLLQPMPGHTQAVSVLAITLIHIFPFLCSLWRCSSLQERPQDTGLGSNWTSLKSLFSSLKWQQSSYLP